ncbi:DUF5686 and carboxypeptidase regulatory-like domain-containing protein [Catalinimonas niigatensis]|uniref:DUF5686 and carboxypeptidase regulatory-like domain-containing protein n=1 Tax=Catalinimonas niigatensis TaxID=1397264 RepID=UPI0026652776|nr:DUF5686 and carboxypeptidase regulatory-like domain-containing protein [Catalinimonas niigatensis]WPP53005.1 DUF5686 and carboxypeptidase regulatory-like domain-containing protein [Catalinimonas niigatensis]
MRHFYLLLFLLCSYASLAQGIKGTVYTPEGEVLPFATIYIKALETGSSTNEQGKYEVALPQGNYELVFQHLGYAPVLKNIQVQNDYVTLDITLSDQVIQLKEVEVNARAEDPAYTIIRKAIAKSKFHRLQVQRYQAKVYIKGAGRVKDVPFFLERALEKEGVDSSTVFLTESVSEVTFEQPNTLKEKVISIRAIGEENNTSPNGFINGSFYDPELVGVISPLSPRAFAYYKFQFAGSFIDRNHEINKIRVIPRSRGDDVFSGYIYIIDDLWSIHSVNMFTYKQGFKIEVKQMSAPIQETVWMPVSHHIDVSGKIFGIDLEYKYLATVSDYDITLNPDLQVDLVVVDEKIEKELAAVLEKEEKLDKSKLTEDSTAIFKNEQRLTRKELRKTLKAYEKELEKQEEAPDVVENRSMSVDSTAYQQDSSYWEKIRPVPLTDMEIKSYQKMDSTAIVEKEEQEAAAQEEKTGVDRPRKNLGLGRVIFGTTISLSKQSSLEYKSPLSELNFNTVEGYHFTVPLVLRTQLLEKQLQIAPTARYAFAREKLTGKLAIHYPIGENQLKIEGGRYVSQFNADDPIHPFLNTFTTLLYEQNFIKLYEKDYVQFGLRRKVSDKLRLEADVSWAKRRQLFNNTYHSWRDRETRVYTPNAPENLELEDTSFPTHDAFIFSVQGEYQPFLKYRIKNEEKSIVNESSPTFRLSYRKGIPEVLNSQVNYDVLEVGVQHQFDIGVRGRLDYHVYAGSFLNNQSLYFMDFQHFMGNRTIIQMSDPVGSFRLLDYYLYSTGKEYLATHLYYQFRKFLFTQFFEVRLLGIKENILFNYLKTDLSPHYMEVGYSLDNVLRFLRVEAVANFEDGKYRNFGVRIGIATTLENLFN